MPIGCGSRSIWFIIPATLVYGIAVIGSILFIGVIYGGSLAVLVLLLLFLRDMRRAWKLADTLRKRHEREQAKAKLTLESEKSEENNKPQ